MKKLLIALTGIMMMGLMTSCNESKVYDPAKMLYAFL